MCYSYQLKKSRELNLLVDELKTGDLIFEIDSMGTAEHVSMYAGEREGLHYQVHATVGRYTHL